ncbi:MAG TPA: CBS domain-containing protein [Actinomycetota bacterium]|jgi:CBS domain-containing protein|nr:CBS domain-containing protein [Actinomycetota bacterium]
MSPRAAWRLESLGFTEVYDYVAGKQDWLAAGLPREGEIAGLPRAADIARSDVPTCRLDERVGKVRERVHEAGWEECVVVNDERIVLGLLRAEELGEARDDEVVEDVMRPGPSTFRPHVHVEEMARFMSRHDLDSSPVTTSDGVLVGMLLRKDAEAAAHRLHQQFGAEHEQG